MEQRENDADALATSPIRAAPAASCAAESSRDQMQPLDKEGMQQTQRGQLALRSATKLPSLSTVRNRPSLQPAEAAADISATKKETTTAKLVPANAADAQLPFEQNAAQEAALHQSDASSDSHEAEQTLLLMEQSCQSEAANNAVSEAANAKSMEQLYRLRLALDDVLDNLLSILNQQTDSGVDTNGNDGAIENAHRNLSSSQLSPLSSESSSQRWEPHSPSASSYVSETSAPLSPVKDLPSIAISQLNPLTSTPICSTSAGCAEAYEALFSGSLADKPLTAFPGIGNEAEERFRQRGIFAVQC